MQPDVLAKIGRYEKVVDRGELAYAAHQNRTNVVVVTAWALSAAMYGIWAYSYQLVAHDPKVWILTLVIPVVAIVGHGFAIYFGGGIRKELLATLEETAGAEAKLEELVPTGINPNTRRYNEEKEYTYPGRATIANTVALMLWAGYIIYAYGVIGYVMRFGH